MKKLLFALFFLCMHYCACAQQDNSQTDIVALIENYLIEKGELKAGVLLTGDRSVGVLLHVGNMLSQTATISDFNSFIRKENIGAFYFKIWSTHSDSYLLLKSGNDCEMLPLFDYKDENGEEVDFMGILNKVTDYFKRHPEIDDRLYPYYISQISEVYLVNTYGHEIGVWNNWHHGPYEDPKVPEKNKYGIDTIDIDEKYSKTILEYYDYKNRTKK